MASHPALAAVRSLTAQQAPAQPQRAPAAQPAAPAPAQPQAPAAPAAPGAAGAQPQAPKPPSPAQVQKETEKVREDSQARQLWVGLEECLQGMDVNDLATLSDALANDADLVASVVGETLAAKTREAPSLTRELQQEARRSPTRHAVRALSRYFQDRHEMPTCKESVMGLAAFNLLEILAQDGSKPVCPNCEQWQYRSEKGHLDCLHDCAARGFAPKVPNPPRQVQRGDAPRSVMHPKPGATVVGSRVPDPRTVTADELREFLATADLDAMIEFAQRNDANGIFGHVDEYGDPRDPAENEAYLRQLISEWIGELEPFGNG